MGGMAPAEMCEAYILEREFYANLRENQLREMGVTDELSESYTRDRIEWLRTDRSVSFHDFRNKNLAVSA